MVLVAEENHGFNSVMDANVMPYLNRLASTYGLATQYYANTHPSIGNYFMLSTGQIITNDDGFTGTVSADNVVRELLAAGKTWKSYAESLPSVGYTGGDSNPYVLHHNPLAYFSDVRNDSTQRQNLVPFGQFASDLANNQLPNFSFVVPNMLNDAHDGSLQIADQWLQNNIDPLFSNAAFQQDGLLIIVWDEAEESDGAGGGGHVSLVVAGPKAKSGYRSSVFYQHQSLLRLVLGTLGVSNFPGASANAADMSEFLR